MVSFERKRASSRRTAGRGRRRGRKHEGGGQVVLGWAALVPVMLAALWNGGEAPVTWTLLSLATLALFAVQVARDLRHGLPGPARYALWVGLPFAAVLIWLQVQSLPGLAPGLAHPVWAVAPDGAVPAISAHPDAGRQVAMRLACYGMLFWIFLRSAGAAGRGGVGYIQGIAVFATALAIYGLVSASIGYNFLLDDVEDIRSVKASFVNRNAYATFAVFGILANITAYVRSVARHEAMPERFALRDFLEAFFASGWLFAFGALVGLVALAMTGSRAGVAAGLIGIVVLLWAVRRSQGKGGVVVWAVPLVLLGFVTLFMTSGLVASIESADDSSRFGIYRQVVAGIADRPWLGHGAGAFPEAFRTYVPADLARFDWERAHNTYLENAFEFGLPAAVLFYLTLALIGWRLLLGVLVRRRHQGTPAFALACLVAAAVHAGFDFSLQFPANAALLAVILGLGWGQGFATRHAVRPSGRSRRGEARRHAEGRPQDRETPAGGSV